MPAAAEQGSAPSDCRSEIKNRFVSRSQQTRQTHRNDLFRRDDCLGLGKVLRPSAPEYEEVVSFYDEIKFFAAVKYFPGVTGGRCVMPNIKLLSKYSCSALLDAIQATDKMKSEREANKLEAQLEVVPVIKTRVA